jgi:outer membrane protein, multidrug efflux system
MPGGFLHWGHRMMVKKRSDISRLALAVFLMAWPQISSAARSRASHALDLAVPANFETGEPLTVDLAAPVSSGAWWKVFGDPALDEMIDRMHLGNTNIRQSAARLAQAQAGARLGKASQMPMAIVDGSASHASGPLINQAGGSGNLFTAGLSVSWEIDLLGKLSGERKAERLDVRASAALLRDTRLLMEAATARAYFQTIYLQQAKAEAAYVAPLWQERQVIAQRRMQTGLGQQIDIDQLQQRSFASASEAAALEGELAQARDTLAFLIGETAPFPVVAHVLPSPPAIPPGLPSEVLARRPDIAASIDRLQAADGRLVSVRRNWFPLFALTGSGGAASSSLGEILSSSTRNFGVGLLFSLPFLDGGRHKSQVAGSVAELDLAKAQYHESMLTAFRDVNDALAAVQTTARQSQLAGQILASSEREQAIVASRAVNGTASRAQLLDTQLAESRLRLNDLDARYQRLAAAVDLVKAIGGN